MPSSAVNRSRSAPAGHVAAVDRIATGHLIEDVAIDGSPPSPQELLRKLRGRLGVSANARIEAMSGFSGGQNKGMWMLRDSSCNLVLKLVDGTRKHPSIPSEAEQLVKLSQEHPGIRSDPSLSFPIRVFGFSDPSTRRKYHLLVMKKASGVPLTDVISLKLSYNQVPRILQILESLGRFIAGVHRRYNCQHNDFQPSNIFYDENTSTFTLIDIGGMGNSALASCKEGDVEHFGESLRILAKGLGNSVLGNEGKTHFMNGYATGRR
jgi:serine/threonine protein kinase